MMRIPLTLCLCGLVMGCLPGASSVDDTSGVVDSGVGGVVINGSLDVPPEVITQVTSATVGVFFLDEVGDQAATGEAIALARDVSVSEQGGNFVIELPEEVSGLRELQPGVNGAPFVLGAWEDRDGDDQPDEDEHMVGAYLQLLVRVEGELTAELEELGFEEGWNLASRDLILDDGPTSARPLQGEESLTLVGNLLPVMPRSLSGTITPSDDEEDTWVSAVGIVGQCPGEGGRQYPNFATTQTEGAGFTFDWPADPPDSSYDATELLDNCGDAEHQTFSLRGAIFELIHYEDVDANNVYDQGTDYVRGRSTESGGNSSVLLWLEATDLTAMAYVQFGGNMGWSRVGIGGIGTAPFEEWSGADIP